MRISDWSSDVCSSDLQIRRWICVPFAHGWPLRSPPGWRRPRLQVSRMACGNGGPAIMPEQSPNGRNRPQKAIVTPSSTRSEEHTSELQSLMRHSYAVICLKTKKKRLQLLELRY